MLVEKILLPEHSSNSWLMLGKTVKLDLLFIQYTNIYQIKEEKTVRHNWKKRDW